MSDLDEQVEKLNAAIAGLEAQRAALGDAVVDPALAALHQQLAQLEASSVESGATEERKIVTILFADVSGFTALAEKKEAEEVRSLINACFEYLVPVVQKYGGTIDKFIGDEIMALFGAPVAHEDDAERALRTALELMEAMAGFNRANGTDLNLHIGINTGPVIAGRIGAQDRHDYSVMGDAVNLAARLEDASPDGQIFVGPKTHHQTEGLFEFEKLPPLNLKGKQSAIEVYRLLGSSAASKRVRGIEGLHASLVGRKAELAEIHSALTAVRRGSGGIVAILGEAGLGKSRLVAEARAPVAATVSWAEGRALSYTAGMSYWLAREILCSLLKVDAEEAPSKIEAALRASLEQKLPGKVDDVYPFLGRVLDISIEKRMEERVKFLPAETVQTRILQAFQDYVRAWAGHQALVLVWEDLHWCDPSSLRVFETLLPLTAEVPLLLLAAARPDEKSVTELLARTGEAYSANYRRIELSPLSRRESGSLIEQLLKIENLPEPMRDLILDRAEGNPFFLEELLRSLLDASLIVLEKGRIVPMREIQSVDIPETLQGVLMARIDRLEAENKAALQKASVIGRVFQQAVLALLYAEKSRREERLEGSLRELERREFIQSREQGTSEAAALQEDEYIFKHAITHDVAYNSMLVSRRKELHKLAAEAIEALFPDRLEELSATLGFHFERANAAEQAAHYLGRAAERAQANFANREAVAFYRSALAQIEPILKTRPDVGRQGIAGRLYEGLGDVLNLMGQHAAARADYDRARAVVPLDERVWHSRLYRKWGSSHAVQRHYEETARSLGLAGERLGLATDASSTAWWEEKVQIELERMFLYYWQGMASEMMELAAQVRPLMEERATPAQRGKFFQMLALSHLSRDRYLASEECLALAQLAASATEESADLPQIAYGRFVLGFAHLWRGNLNDAVETFEAALQLAERVGDLVIQARCLTYLIVAYRRAHQIEGIKRYAPRTLQLANQIGMVEYVAMVKASLAWVFWREGNSAEAETSAREALKLWHGMKDPYGFDWMALWPLIALAFSQEKMAEAIEAARALFGPNQHPLPQELTTITRQAIDHWEGNEREMALTDLAHAIEAAEKIGQL